ncbi:hypothetical protein [Natrinema salaciae]|uniref:Uncharacterized protein n=1 Tax=Natrinema salaciae TaxID=1186196 RepID=A0A1H9RRI9_9EURY|nr:hypothetical protein [Natrinema salaciae]SER75326.1 hypothetical protein SAMN04489841_4512 [Natrinema salaciae]
MNPKTLYLHWDDAVQDLNGRLYESIAKANDERYRLLESELWDEVRDAQQRRNSYLAACIVLRNRGGEA